MIPGITQLQDGAGKIGSGALTAKDAINVELADHPGNDGSYESKTYDGRYLPGQT